MAHIPALQSKSKEHRYNALKTIFPCSGQGLLKGIKNFEMVAMTFYFWQTTKKWGMYPTGGGRKLQ